MATRNDGPELMGSAAYDGAREIEGDDAIEREIAAELNDDQAGSAIGRTESEIFESANEIEEPDDDGDRSLEEMTEEFDDSDLDQPEGDEAAPELRTEQQQEPAPDPRDVELAALRERLAKVEGRVEAQPAPAPEKKAEPAPKPDMFADPEGYEKWVLDQAEARAAASYQRLEQERQERHVNTSFERVAKGERALEFGAAYRSLTALDPKDAASRQTVQDIVTAPNPGAALLDWWDHGQGKSFRADMLKQLGATDEMIAQLTGGNERQPQRQQGERGEAPARQPSRRIPSLNGKSGSGTHRVHDPELYNGSETSVFQYALK